MYMYKQVKNVIINCSVNIFDNYFYVWINIYQIITIKLLKDLYIFVS